MKKKKRQANAMPVSKKEYYTFLETLISLRTVVPKQRLIDFIEAVYSEDFEVNA